MSDIEQWKEWNRQGLFPGPDETEADWTRRIAFCLQLKRELAQIMGDDFPFLEEESSEGIQITVPLYDLSPEWVPLFFNNFQLAPWHGGCAWIFQLNEQTPTAAFLQLRASFKLKKKYLHFYQRQEIIAHELVHIGRMMFEEPEFEEILAYRTSSSRWRRWLGPIVQSSKESLLFLGTVALITMANLALLALEHPLPLHISLGLWLIPLVLFFMALIRLAKRQWIFNKCCRQLKTIFLTEQKAHAMACRLSDHEISLFARSSPADIRIFMAGQDSFRWRFLNAIYLSDV